MTNNKLIAERFIPECLKAHEISGDLRMARIAELMNWFDRYYRGAANPKWLKSHAAELCYYILSESQPLTVIKRTDERLEYLAAWRGKTVTISGDELANLVAELQECRKTSKGMITHES